MGVIGLIVGMFRMTPIGDDGNPIWEESLEYISTIRKRFDGRSRQYVDDYSKIYLHGTIKEAEQTLEQLKKLSFASRNNRKGAKENGVD